ncbi:MAG TPA: DUF1810 domain-containing protein [Devosia sp.]|nr:DUF1810 domain-containing protein [Devosia sp.]
MTDLDAERFLAAQAPVYDTVVAELGAGRKPTHWMWFVFPQLAALGHSPTAQFYGLADLAAAEAYIAHPVLGPRLLACTELVNGVEGRSAHAIFGTPDDLKFRSSLTLFQRAAPGEAAFPAALGKYYDGVADAATLRLIG